MEVRSPASYTAAECRIFLGAFRGRCFMLGYMTLNPLQIHSQPLPTLSYRGPGQALPDKQQHGRQPHGEGAEIPPTRPSSPTVIYLLLGPTPFPNDLAGSPRVPERATGPPAAGRPGRQPLPAASPLRPPPATGPSRAAGGERSNRAGQPRWRAGSNSQLRLLTHLSQKHPPKPPRRGAALPAQPDPALP